jgi:type IV pilus assembly protein PilA
LPNGFTLMELLIVMAIIAILMLIAIPTVGSLKKNANRCRRSSPSAPSSRPRCSMSPPTRPTGTPARCRLWAATLAAGAPSPTGAQILQADLTSGFKQGYIFTISNCTKVTVNGTDRMTSYTVTAFLKRWARPATAASAATSSAPSSLTPPAAPTAPSRCNERTETPWRGA